MTAVEINLYEDDEFNDAYNLSYTDMVLYHNDLGRLAMSDAEIVNRFISLVNDRPPTRYCVAGHLAVVLSNNPILAGNWYDFVHTLDVNNYYCRQLGYLHSIENMIIGTVNYVRDPITNRSGRIDRDTIDLTNAPCLRNITINGHDSPVVGSRFPYGIEFTVFLPKDIDKLTLINACRVIIDKRVDTLVAQNTSTVQRQLHPTLYNQANRVQLIGPFSE